MGLRQNEGIGSRKIDDLRHVDQSDESSHD
jgi:hypothetical protein